MSASSGTRYGTGSSGPGWGGPRKGASAAQRHVLNGAGPGRGHFSVKGEERREREARHAQEAREFYYEVMHDPEEPTPIRLQAATHLLNRIEGAPAAKVEMAPERDADADREKFETWLAMVRTDSWRGRVKS